MANYSVGLVDSDKIIQILYGLSYNKTLAQKSKFSVDQVERYTGKESATSYGDNFSMATFKRWVKEEMAYQLGEYAKACLKDPFNLMDFLVKKTNARNKYFQINITAQQEIGNQNKAMAEVYTACMKTTASVQYTAEMALLTVGTFATAPTSLALFGGRVLVGVGGGIAIAVAENWSQAKNSDMIVMPVTEQLPSNIVSNIPSINKDWVDVCDGLSKQSLYEIEKAVAMGEKQLTNANRALKTTTNAATRAAIQADISSIKAQNAKDLAMLHQLKAGMNIPKPPQPFSGVGYNANARTGQDFRMQVKPQDAHLPTAAKAFGRGLQGVCWALAVKSAFDSTTKFAKHYRGEF